VWHGRPRSRLPGRQRRQSRAESVAREAPTVGGGSVGHPPGGAGPAPAQDGVARDPQGVVLP
jgi:hypothetical protein